VTPKHRIGPMDALFIFFLDRAMTIAAVLLVVLLGAS